MTAVNDSPPPPGGVGMLGAGASAAEKEKLKQKRKRSMIACKNCNERRVRCDGATMG